MTIKNEGDVPINRLIKKGADSLSTTELLSIIIGNGVQSNVSTDICAEVLETYSITELGCVSPKMLQSINGIGKAKSGQISAVFELAKRYSTETEFGTDTIRLSSPEVAYQYLYPRTKGQKKEMFICLMLDTKNQLISEDVISIGSLNANIVHPREVFKSAIVNSAAAIIIAHNHPSGDPAPSQNDIDITRKLMETGRVVGIEVYDHIIIGDGRYLSMKEQNLMQ